MERKPFSSKYHHRGRGITLAVIGALFFFASVGNFGEDAGTATFGVLLGLGLAALGVYYLRGTGVDPAIAQRQAEQAQRQAAHAAAGMDQATQALAATTTGAGALIAYRNLEATAKRLHPAEAQAKLQEALASIQFDMARIGAPRYGSIRVLTGGFLEVFRDYVIHGQEGYDVDLTTRGGVHVDGSVQVTSQIVLDKKNRQQMVNQHHDMRTATVQFTSAEWALTVQIHPDHANEARALVQRLATHVDNLKPQALSQADVQSMLNAIVNNSSGQTATQRIEELDKLRYSRLLNDEEFGRLKNQILGL